MSVVSGHSLTTPGSPVSNASQTVVEQPTSAQGSGSTLKSSTKSAMAGGIPRDQVRLDVLLISGHRRFFLFDGASSVKSVRERIWDEWPEDWPMKPQSRTSIRILHLGHILDDKTILCTGVANVGEGAKANAKPSERIAAGAMRPGQSYVVHLLVRQEQSRTTKENDESTGKTKKSSEYAEDGAEVSGGCCCVIC